MTAWTSDIAFALDRLARLNASDSSGKFTGRLDTARWEYSVTRSGRGGAVLPRRFPVQGGIDIDAHRTAA